MQTAELIPVDRKGIFKARPLTYAMKKAEDTQSWGVSITWELFEMLQGSNWIPWNFGQSCEGTFWFIKKDGTFNDNAVETLRDVLGWNGDPDSVDQGTWVVPEAQVTVEAEEYKGKTRFRVAWAKAIDFEPKTRASSEEVSGLKSAYGSKLKAVFGMKSHSSSRPNGTPPPLPSKSAPPPLPVAQAPKGVTRDDAWSSFSAKADTFNPKLTSDHISKEWFRILKLLLNDKLEDQFDAADWQRVRDEAPPMIAPF